MKESEALTIDEEIEVAILLSEYLNIMRHMPLKQDEFWKRKNLISKYQRSVSKYCDDQ